MRKLILFPVNLLFNVLRRIFSFRINYSGKILILTFHKLGDTIFTFDSIARVLDHYGEKNCVIITLENNIPLYKLEFPDAHYISFRRSDFLGYREIPRYNIIKAVRNLRAEKIFDISTGTRTALILLFSGAREIIGSNVEFYRGIYSSFTRLNKNCHVREIYPEIINIDPELPQKPVSETKKVHLPGGNYILIHPFAAWRSKEWGIRKYIDLATRLRNNYEVRFIAESNSLSPEIVEEIKNLGFTIKITKGVNDLIKETKDCRLFIGNDSGPIYLANYFNVPTFTIYGPTNPLFHLPFNGVNGHIRNLISCSPVDTKLCFLDGGRQCFHFSCMSGLSVDRVYDSVMEFISSNKIFSEKRIGDAEH